MPFLFEAIDGETELLLPTGLTRTDAFWRPLVDEIPEEDRDLSSILDEVAAAGIPTQQLNWHYRSRDESLIAFSN